MNNLIENPKGEETTDPVQEKDQSPSAEVNSSENPDITEVFSDPVVKEEGEKNTEVNLDDFKIKSFGDQKKEGEKSHASAEAKKEPGAGTSSETKNHAVARGAKPSTLVLFGDILLKRIGPSFSKRPKEYWQLSAEDKQDLTILVEDTIKEGDYSGIPTKWLLIGVLAMIILAKVMNRNNPDYEPSKKVETAADYESIRAQTKARADSDKEFSLMKEQIQALTDQNKMLRDLLSEKKGNIDDDTAEIIEETKNVRKIDRIYNGYDLAKISFTERGALVDPSKAGQPGYTDEGKKMGNISKEHQDLREKWSIYREQYKRSIVNA